MRPDESRCQVDKNKERGRVVVRKMKREIETILGPSIERVKKRE